MEEEHWYIRAGFGFSALWIVLLVVLSIFDITRKFIPVTIIAFIAMWCITLINVWLSNDKKIKVRI